ncbi:unnamed protein product [Cyclocybe aegerita]|uniref:DNA helicase n=1 Tax=Cyclocybe aegerita TaxID=1973307 RepID=A0A8S0W448_CYCAE|nr:unnamed protein product [Cyclocybe aegerita]
MISATESTADNKRQVLEQLRFSKNSRENRTQVSPLPPDTALESPSQSQYPTPPPQSRDATVPSRFFPTTPSTLGNVLVPNSSPTSYEDTTTRPYQPYNHLRSHDVASTSGSFYNGDWMQPRGNFMVDPLSAPSGFVSHGASSNASLRRQWNGDEHFNHNDGPPRKKVNRGTSADAFAVPESPPSPVIQRMGNRRTVQMIGGDAMSFSSDESFTESSRNGAGPSKPRLTKTRPSPSPESQSTSEPPSDREFISFKMTHPLESAARIQAAWTQSGSDMKKATGFLSDPAWSPTPTTKSPEKDHLGKVKEIEEANKAQRAAVKEKGKKSLIYANRPVLEAKIPSTPPLSKPLIDLTAPSPGVLASPLTPAIRGPQRKRAKKLVIHSDSESGADDESDDDRGSKRSRSETSYEMRALEYLNTSGADALQELTGCTPEQAEVIISLRPFESGDDIRNKLGRGKKKAGPSGISPRMFEDCTEMLKGYGSVDNVLEDCEKIGASLRATISSWSQSNVQSNENKEDGAISLLSLASLKSRNAKNYLTTQPKLLSDTVTLKEYQLLGVNWLNLLYRSNLSCILADEMGLGKTIQVISFLAYLKEIGNKGPHLIVVPSSTLENWCREFSKFAPSISVQTYYADKKERPMLRQTLLDTQRSSIRREGWEVLITTYNLAQGDDRDRKFFRKIDWDCCVYDEGHVLKNFQSQRYQSLLKFGSNWRLLLTGTPLQNNLQELVSLLNFILPDKFADSMEDLRAIFKVKGDTKVSLLSQERISRAKKMMTPFVLRRRKDQVLKDLPNKTERIEWCDMTELQRTIYRETLQRSRKIVLEPKNEEPNGVGGTKSAKKTKAGARAKDKQYAENSSNVLMDLRKAASHPMLFRMRFTDDTLTGITKQLLKEPDFSSRGALFEHVKEDMSVMTDAELQIFCATYKAIDAEFTQILDILQAVLKHHDVKFLVLTGSTPVDIRQTLVDEFTEDDSIPIFLLSTKAGGMGINLTAASVVIMFDQDFNPHNDRQAQDRAYRIGQKRDVEVVKLISKGTIEEDMLRLGETKLALDEAVAGDGDGDEKEDSAPERAMRTSLMNVLRQQLENEQSDDTPDPSKS